MPAKLYWNTVTPLLKSILERLMSAAIFNPFRLVGGTALSLQIGHRISVDIDLFTDAAYDSVDFDAIDQYLRNAFEYVTAPTPGPVSFGRSYFVGTSGEDVVKLDLYYTDKFIQPSLHNGIIRMATIDEIIAMKMDVVQRGGRKKDFWDLHELTDQYTLADMIALHQLRHPYVHDAAVIKTNFTDFAIADDDFEPTCLRGKHWEIVKLDLVEYATK
jgi:hypothetical protein